MIRHAVARVLRAGRFGAIGWAAVVCGMVLALPSDARVKAPSQILITHDLGGPVEQRMRQVERMRQRGEGVAIPHGRCISACTLYLGLPDTCVGRHAEFGFHGPAAATRGLGLPLPEFQRISTQMAAFYPAPLRDWFLSTARYTTQSYIAVSGAQLIQLGFKECV